MKWSPIAGTRISGNLNFLLFPAFFSVFSGLTFGSRPVAETFSNQAIAKAPILSIQKN